MLLMSNKRRDANGDYVTGFTSVAYTSGETYSFPNTNNRLSIRNCNDSTLTLTLNGNVYTILPFKSILLTESYTQFTISSNINSSAFEVMSIIDNADDPQLELDSVISQLKDIVHQIRPYNYINYGKYINRTTSDNHYSWARTFYDADNDKIFIAYTVAPVHGTPSNRVLYCTMTPSGVLSTPVFLADRIAENYSCSVHGVIKAANGDYIAIIAVMNQTTYVPIGNLVYRSTDKGTTWTGTSAWVTIDGVQWVGDNSDMTGLTVLSNGRIIALAKDNITKISTLLYSDDNGATWHKGTIGGNYTYLTEPSFLELDDGVIVGYLRATVDGNFASATPAKFTKSLDGGITWSVPVDSVSIIDMNNNNGTLIKRDDGLVEFIFGSRFQQSDSLSSIYATVSTQKDVENDNFQKPVRIGKFRGCVPVDSVYGDGGYLQGCKDKYGTIHMFYYNGTKANSDICYLKGMFTNSIEQLPYTVDNSTGLPLSDSNTIDNTITEIYYNGDEKTSITGGWVAGWSIGTGSILKNSNNLYATVSGTGDARKGYKPTNGIDVTNIKYIYAAINITSITGSAGASITLYNKSTPTSTTDGRIAVTTCVQKGYNIIKMDVRNITGIVYPNVTTYIGNSTSGSIECYFYEVWCENAESLQNLNSFNNLTNISILTPVLKTPWYTLGNEKASRTGGWATGLSYGTSAALTKNATSIKLSINENASVAGRSTTQITNGINLTNVNFICARIDLIKNTGSVDLSSSGFGITVYNKSNPTTASDGKVKETLSYSLGETVIRFNVVDVTGINYIDFEVWKQTTPTAQVEVDILEVWYE